VLEALHPKVLVVSTPKFDYNPVMRAAMEMRVSKLLHWGGLIAGE
jgi:hypothetical protein